MASTTQHGLAPDASLSAFDFLFREMVEYSMTRRKVVHTIRGTNDNRTALPTVSPPTTRKDSPSQSEQTATATVTAPPATTTTTTTTTATTVPASVEEIESKLAAIGYRVGYRASELIRFRIGDSDSVPVPRGSVFQTRRDRRETRVVQALSFVQVYVWRYLFGHAATALEESVDDDSEYMISDNDPSITALAAAPREHAGSLSVAAFAAGIVEAILDGYQFPCAVSAHRTGDAAHPQRVTLLIRFSRAVVEREARLADTQ